MNYKRMQFLLFLTLLVPLCIYAGEESVYIKHSSDLILANNGSGQAVIVDKTSSLALPMRLVDTSDGWLNIELTQANGEVLFLNKSGGWDAKFESTANGDNAKFRIDGNQAGMVKLVCKANDRCLGTDDNASGSYVFSDKEGNDVKHLWFITTDKNANAEPQTVQFDLDATNLKQIHEGWGVSLCWWANMCGKWSDAKIDKIIDWLVSPTGLNYNIFRYNIGGGDDPENHNCTPHHMGSGKGLRAEMEGFKDFSDDEYHWDRDAAQRKIMLKIKEKRPDAIFEAFSNSAPWYMTVSGCCAGHSTAKQDNLRKECYTEFANYLVDVCKHYKEEYGIEFKTLAPFNEPETDYWYCNGSQEGCHFDFTSQVAFIKVLYPILKSSGLNTVISVADETAVSAAITGFNTFKSANILHMIGQCNTHTYWANNSDRTQYSNLARTAKKMLWQSETGDGGSGLSGNLSLAQRLIDDIRYIAPDAWLDWQYIEEGNDQWCLVQGDFAAQTFNRVKNYFVRQQFSRFILKGYTFLGTNNEQTLAAISPERDTLVVVTLNNTALEQNVKINLKNFNGDNSGIKCYLTDASRNLRSISSPTIDDEGALAYTLPSTSIQTLVIPQKASDAIAQLKTDSLISCIASDGALHINSNHPCTFAVYNPNGAIVHKGHTHANLALPANIYIVRAEDGTHAQSFSIKVGK